MPTSISAAELPNHIQKLLEQRAQHTEAVGKIDQTLANVATALGATAAPIPTTKPAAAPVAAKAKAPVVKAKKGKRSKFAVSATDLVLAFIKAKKNPTTKEITQHLLSEGRSAGAVSNALSVLTTAKKLKRTPLGKGIMGSTYSLA